MTPFWPKQMWFPVLWNCPKECHCLFLSRTRCSNNPGQMCRTSKHTSTKPSCMETVQEYLIDKDFSSGATEQNYGSSSSVFRRYIQANGRLLKDWFFLRDIDPPKVSVPQVADFLLHLFHYRNVSFKTLEDYRTAISKPILFALILVKILVCFLTYWSHFSEPRAMHLFPPWYLLFILISLIKQPF